MYCLIKRLISFVRQALDNLDHYHRMRENKLMKNVSNILIIVELHL